MLRGLFLVVAVLAAGCAGPAPGAPARDLGEPPAAQAPPSGALVASAGVPPRHLGEAMTLRFGPSVALTPEGHSFEPSLEVAPDGTVYVTAPPPQARPHERGRPSSFIWHSKDGGATWLPMPSPMRVHEWMPGLEGDLALDGKGRIYLVDTYAGDTSLTRWAPGPAWESSRPLQGTLGADDRPWLAAHGDGILYYLGNGGVPLPAPHDALAGAPGDGSSQWLYVSTDAGLTWTPGRGFDGSRLCNVAASPADDRTLVVGCVRYGAITRGAEGAEAVLHASADRGATWTSEVVGRYERGVPGLYPSVAFDAAGHAYFLWNDGGPREGAPTRLFLARGGALGPYDVLDITPFVGAFERVWVAAGARGAVGLAFYATRDARPGAESEWRAYAMASADALAAEPVWEFAPVDAEPVWRGAASPGDFLQAAIGPDGALHVAFQRDTAPPEPEGAPVTFGGPSGALHARQTMR